MPEQEFFTETFGVDGDEDFVAVRRDEMAEFEETLALQKKFNEDLRKQVEAEQATEVPAEQAQEWTPELVRAEIQKASDESSSASEYTRRVNAMLAEANRANAPAQELKYQTMSPDEIRAALNEPQSKEAYYEKLKELGMMSRYVG